VTGAGGGISRAICRLFLREGACVAAADVDLPMARAAIDGALPERAIALNCDVGDSESVRRAVQQAVAAFGGLNVLCNVAGGSTRADAAVTEAPEAEFWRAIRVDLFGIFLCCKHALPYLVRAGGGSVINMGSMVALTPVHRKDCYTAAKGGVVALTRSMALEYASHGVRVNAISPGITATPRVEAFMAASPDMQAIGRRHLLGLVQPEEIAHMAVYLASAESRTVTGQVQAVDSGVSMR
jgi:NAD(P)-dependent dehydrogenase (short-subunit alcohol dehydrogenase family)